MKIFKHGRKDDNPGVVSELTLKLADAIHEVMELESKFDLKDTEIVELKDGLEPYSSARFMHDHIDKLVSEVNSSERECSELRKKLPLKDAEIADLKAELETRDKQYAASLGNLMEEKDRVAELKVALQESVKLWNDLKAELEQEKAKAQPNTYAFSSPDGHFHHRSEDIHPLVYRHQRKDDERTPEKVDVENPDCEECQFKQQYSEYIGDSNRKIVRTFKELLYDIKCSD